MKITRNLIVLSLLCAVSALGATFGGTETTKVDLPIDADGSVWIENPIGNIDVIGTDDNFVSCIVQKIVRGANDASVAEAREQTQILTSGDTRIRAFKTQLPPLRSMRWSSSVNFFVRVPKSVLVKIGSQSAEHIHVSNLTRSVTVKNTNGAVVLESVTGSAMVESVNGNITFDSKGNPAANAQLTTVNGRVDIVAPADASFRWVGQTIAGDFRTNFSTVTGRMNGTNFRGGINGGHGPTITTASLMGIVSLMRRGANPREARSVRSFSSVVATGAEPPPLDRKIQMPFYQGDYTFSTSLGNVEIGQVFGSAKIDTGAGEIRLGLVRGDCTLLSRGGQLTLGDIFGTLNVRTKAGDVLINAARAGGFASTGGGLVRVLYASGPLTLHSDGGDIIVRSTTGGVIADTPSGDVTITLDPTVRSVPLDLKTGDGNIVIKLGPRFAADIDAIVITSDADASAIHSDFSGLSLRRESFNGRTRIHATGKVNGGGDRVTLYAEEGDIRVSAQAPHADVSPNAQDR